LLAARQYAPYVRGDLLYSVLMVALFVVVLAGVWVLDWLLTRRQTRRLDRSDEPKPGRPELPRGST